MADVIELTPEHIDKLAQLAHANLSDVFSFLGLHQLSKNLYCCRVYLPNAQRVSLVTNKAPCTFERYQNTDLFYLELAIENTDLPIKLAVDYPEQRVEMYDCYSFPSAIDEEAMYLFNEGTLAHAHHHFGCQRKTLNGVEGVQFCLWAPNAKSISLIGDFNFWDARVHQMRKHPASGVWDIFIPQLKDGEHYKYSILTATGERVEKADPYAFQMQQAPNNASIVCTIDSTPCVTVSKEHALNQIERPISIYEVHLGSWRRQAPDGSEYLSYRELAHQLVSYVLDMGFTHIQLMPIADYPFDGSWGYQPIGLFAPTSRFGSFADFCYFVETIKSAGIGLIIDWVPAHFPSDPHGLVKFDGTHLYEHADMRQGFHPDWQTHIFNYDRPEVRSYLLSSATYWLETFQLDGIRVDAVASMLYLDYSREENNWIPNCFGGRENLGAVSLLQQINQTAYKNNTDIMMVAEESTAWQGVTNFTSNGGLGFGYKWNMGWMNDSLSYMNKDPIYRKFHHQEMTFSLVYAFSENFILPLSHDEVVHGKGSLINKMPGDDWQKFANLRCYYGFMWAHPGKKLLFMGGEFAQYHEWSHDKSLDWHLLAQDKHQGIQRLIRELNILYRATPALYLDNLHYQGFKWIDSQNSQQSIFSFARFEAKSKRCVICISNMTPQVHVDFRLGVPQAANYKLLLNTDDAQFGGSGVNPGTSFAIEQCAGHGFEQSISLTIAPLATYYLVSC